MTKSGCLPCMETMYPLLFFYVSGAALKAMSRSGAIRSAGGAPGSRVMYLSPVTTVVSGLPRCSPGGGRCRYPTYRQAFWTILPALILLCGTTTKPPPRT